MINVQENFTPKNQNQNKALDFAEGAAIVVDYGMQEHMTTTSIPQCA